MNKVQPALQALLAKSIDYAGLFPPASLQLEPALKNFARDLGSTDAWMLSTFVLPIAKFADAAWFFSEFDQHNPLRISALGPRTMKTSDFTQELKNVNKGIHRLIAESRGLAQIDQLEMPLPAEFDTSTFTAIREMAAELAVQSFWEAAADDAPRIIALLREGDAKRPLAFKLRTGGVTADAFPSSAQIAQALVVSARSKVPIKFTAGLHHPVRMFRDEVNTKMHGFLNVFGAGVLGLEHRWDEAQTMAMLEEEDAGAFVFSGDTLRWRDWQIAADKIVQHRRLITSFGSCSFDEPRQDLRALQLLL